MTISFSKKITKWYLQNKRELPWRDSTDPYIIWLSEIILQQTRIEQGLPYFYRFVSAFPDVKALANASEQQVLKLWQGLGYYSRARNLHHTARIIVKDFDAIFPVEYHQILKLKGIGSYTAAAISSFAFNQPCAVVDGNVFRLLARCFGIDAAINSPAGKKLFEELAQTLLDKKNPSIHNQAMMEMGAVICKPANPLCEICALQSICVAYKSDLINQLPVKNKIEKIRNRWLNYLIITSKSKIVLHKRTGNNIWKNLFDFPAIETDKKIAVQKILHHPEMKALLNKQKFVVKMIESVPVHKLSHQNIHATFLHLEIVGLKKLKLQGENIIVTQSDIHQYPLPRLIDRYLEKLKVKL